MMRLALILCGFATPVTAQVVPTPRPADLVERSQAAAEAAATGTEHGPGAPNALAGAAPGLPQVETPDRAAIGAQIAEAIEACWTVSNLSEQARGVSIVVAFDTIPEGEVVRESIEMTGFSGGTQVAADEAMAAAVRAITRCANDGLDLPPETYPVWQRIELTFDPFEGQMR
ncbi:hypothetical protein [Jannaschia sp. CCS1]|uniref:hypothetical protein n=1 Tax=Jannaschia sp. (strain CCS1) TaxID=290400 RepID=UPI000053C7F5|nr:hypothetical protein [Jannaschia sp. CCS1]ABD53890.1 hypothetical protein Jann_0973 [Jannaschia sp. CCS1]